MDDYIRIKVKGTGIIICDGVNNHRCYTTIEGLPDTIKYYKYIRDRKLRGEMTRMSVSNYRHVFHVSPIGFDGNYVKPERINAILNEIDRVIEKNTRGYDRKQLENESYESLLTIYSLINASRKLAECT